jgi:hypothetical protein
MKVNKIHKKEPYQENYVLVFLTSGKTAKLINLNPKLIFNSNSFNHCSRRNLYVIVAKRKNAFSINTQFG